MSKRPLEKKSQSTKTLILYGVIVLCLISISLMIKVYNIIRESRFDGQHRFTVAIGEGEKSYGLISFEPSTSSLSFLSFGNKTSIPFVSINKTVGIIPDAYIKTRYSLNLEDTAPKILQSILLNPNNNSRNVTFYDLLRFWYYANKIPESTVSITQIPVKAERSVFDRASSLLFSDSMMASENISIQIVNATGESGLGGRLERVITNMGGNVVSVITAKKEESLSMIQYGKTETYTLRKLSSLLGYRKGKLPRGAIADIVILVGNDNKDTQLF